MLGGGGFESDVSRLLWDMICFVVGNKSSGRVKNLVKRSLCSRLKMHCPKNFKSFLSTSEVMEGTGKYSENKASISWEWITPRWGRVQTYKISTYPRGYEYMCTSWWVRGKNHQISLVW